MKLTVGMRFVVEASARNGYLPSRDTQIIVLTALGHGVVNYRYVNDSGTYGRDASTFHKDINQGVVKLEGLDLAVGGKYTVNSGNVAIIESLIPFKYRWEQGGYSGLWGLPEFVMNIAQGNMRAVKTAKPVGASPVAPKPAAPAPIKTSPDILSACLMVQAERGKQRDSADGERSMKRTVDMFNACFGTTLTETQGWQFMVCLKMARSVHGEFTMDDYIDGTSYFALAGESAAKEA